MNLLELARSEDIEKYDQIIDGAKEFQKAQGFVQWTEDYPNQALIEEDVRSQKGYALKIDGALAGYMYIDFDGEPVYEEIEGEWLTEAPYAVVHRIAFDEKFRGRGLTPIAFGLIEELCRAKGMGSIRMDTDPCNQRMQHVLKKNGFRQCGVIMFQGSGKLAFEKVLGETE